MHMLVDLQNLVELLYKVFLAQFIRRSFRLDFLFASTRQLRLLLDLFLLHFLPLILTVHLSPVVFSILFLAALVAFTAA